MGVGDPSSLLDTEVDVALEKIVLRAACTERFRANRPSLGCTHLKCARRGGRALRKGV